MPSNFAKLIGLILGLLCTLPVTLAQQSDRNNEEQVDRIPIELVPPAPPLTPEEALKTFKLPAGFRIEVVAAEPMVESPVAVQFGPDGKMWGLEMQLASVITYIRREWGHTASPVDPAEVAAIRRETSERSAAWTEAELQRIP